jgi:hypothetical protein
MKLAGFDKAIEPGICMRTTWGVCKEPITATYRQWANGPFITIVVDLKHTVVTVTDSKKDLLRAKHPCADTAFHKDDCFIRLDQLSKGA